MSASPDDILTALQNVVLALSNNTQAYLRVNGLTNATGLTTASVVKSGAGRVCTVSVLAAGSSTGKVYDSTSTVSTSNPIFTIPMTTGAFVVNMPVLFGIVVAPGSGQTVSVAYS